MIKLFPDLTPETEISPALRALIICLIFCLLAFGSGVLIAMLIVDRDAVQDDISEVQEEMVLENEPQDVEDSVVAEDPLEPVFINDEEQALRIDWITPYQQIEVPFEHVLFNVLCQPTFMDKDAFNDEPGLIQSSCMTYTDSGSSPVPYARAYQLGTVRGGVYDGRVLEMNVVAQEGLGTYFEQYYILRGDVSTKPIIVGSLAKISGWSYAPENSKAFELLTSGDRLSKLVQQGYVVDNSIRISELEVHPQTTEQDVSQNNYRLLGYTDRLNSMRNGTFSLVDFDQKIVLKNGSLLYSKDLSIMKEYKMWNDGLFYGIDEDGTVLWYELDVPFWNYQSDNGLGAPLPIVWNNGERNQTTYLKGKVGGCGFTTSTNLLSQETVRTLPPFVQVGKAIVSGGNSYAIFEPTSYDNEYYTKGFNALSEVFVTQGDGTRKSFADFEHPYVYFQDANGRWVEFMSNEIIPPVECGKPVIYLYPETTTDIDVTLKPVGGFSYTEPAYKDGWQVTAYPDGTLVNKADGKSYPYLFWEGRGGMYESPLRYWVVAREDVEPFLYKTLKQMNLNATETKDFVEFWLPRMKNAPYYKIGFHGTNVMNMLAPLTLSQKPDHVFRMLMDYEELMTKIPSNPPQVTPKADRSGFEVIEWGGVLR